MAIYGINFNGEPIPAGFKRKFAAERPIFTCKACGLQLVDKDYHGDHCTVATRQGVEYQRYKPQGERGIARLQGVCTSWDESRMMCIQADNGHRKVFRVRRKTAGEDFYGIYCY